MAITNEKGKYFNIFLHSSCMSSHYCPDGSIHHSCHSKQKIGLFLFALYMYNHLTDRIPNSINIPNIKATNTSSNLSFSHCFQSCTAPPRSSMLRFKVRYFSVYICYINAPINLEETRVVWLLFFVSPINVGQYMLAGLLTEHDRCTVSSVCIRPDLVVTVSWLASTLLLFPTSADKTFQCMLVRKTRLEGQTCCKSK